MATIGAKIKVGIIGGTGIDQELNILESRRQVTVNITPYGWASDHNVTAGEFQGIPVYILARHGRNHDTCPSKVNYRANLWTLVKQLGCTHILVTSACGSLKEEIKPGQIGILNQYIDRTTSFRDRTFYQCCHIGQKDPCDKVMQAIIEKSCKTAGISCHPNLTVVTIEGPRFSTLAESNLHRSWNCDVVNMTSVPEVQLAAELGAVYGCLLLVTDYDCWRSDEEGVNNLKVIERMKDLSAKAGKVVPLILEEISKHDWVETLKNLEKDSQDAILYQ